MGVWLSSDNAKSEKNHSVKFPEVFNYEKIEKMNRLNKTTKLAVGTSLVSMLFNALKQSIEIDKGTREKFSWGEVANYGLGGFAIGAGVGLIWDTIISQRGTPRKFHETQYLKKVLLSHDPKDTSEYEFQKRKASEIKQVIQEEFHQMIYAPRLSGSLGKGTGIAGRSDYDLVVPYQKHAFRSLEEMYDATHAVLDEHAAGDPEILKVRRQGKSIGLICRSGNIDAHIDIVPARERGNYPVDGDLSLHVRARDWFTTATYTKTNIQKHKEIMKGNPDKQHVARLLKVWQATASVDVSGFEIELLVDKAFESRHQMPRTLFGKVIVTSTFIYENIETIDLRDPGVQSKRVMTDERRRQGLRRKIGNMLEDISIDRNNVKNHFPGNF